MGVIGCVGVESTDTRRDAVARLIGVKFVFDSGVGVADECTLALCLDCLENEVRRLGGGVRSSMAPKPFAAPFVGRIQMCSSEMRVRTHVDVELLRFDEEGMGGRSLSALIRSDSFDSVLCATDVPEPE